MKLLFSCFDRNGGRVARPRVNGEAATNRSTIVGRFFLKGHSVVAQILSPARRQEIFPFVCSSREIDLQREIDALRAELEFANQRMVEMERLATLGNWVAVVAHTLRNICQIAVSHLTIINGKMIEMAGVDGKIDVDNLVSNLSSVTAAVSIMRKTVSSILALAKANPQTGVFGIRDQMDAIRPILEDFADNKRVPLRISISGSITASDGLLLQEGDFTHMLVNSTTNAIEACLERKCAGVSVEISKSPAGHAIIVVADDGPGIPPEILEALREGRVVSSKGTKGCGIGVTAVRQLVEAAGGKLTIANNATGHGAAFTIDLPIVQYLPDMTAPSGSAAALVADKPALVTRVPRSVLVIEDNADGADSMRQLLEAEGFTVTIASSGNQGRTEFFGRRPDVLIMDRILPDVDGLALIEDLLSSGTHRPGLALLCTGDEEMKNARFRTKFQRLGVQLLPKPFDPKALIRLISCT